MATLAQIREGIRANLAANLSLGAYTDPQISGYALSPGTLPSIQVLGPAGIEYDKAMGRGHDDYEITVQAIVALTTDRGAQELLDRMLDPSGAASVKTAIEADRTLGGVVDHTWVVSATGYRQYSTTQGEALGCEFTVAVIA